MKIPVAPPPLAGLIDEADHEDRLAAVLGWSATNSAARGPYLSWDRMRFKTPPSELTVEEWWLATKLARRSVNRPIETLVDRDGQPFTYCLPDDVLEAVDDITRRASGSIAVDERVTNPGSRDRYLVNSFIEEAITSSQLEGAATTREVAKEMLRAGRRPRNHGERMIVNNFVAMQYVSELQRSEMTPDLVREIHRIVTDGPLEDPIDAGRLQTEDENRIAVHDEFGTLRHAPPPCTELPERLQRLCDFANGSGDTGYMPPVLRALTVHFMAGYDHYFADGNGRTARALFYWTMLRNGYWLTEYLSISRILKQAPSQYGRSFLLTEQDDGDLTHFYLHHLGVIRRAITELHDYLAEKTAEIRQVSRAMAAVPGEYNHRQLAVLERALSDPDVEFTARSHARSHHVTEVTARTDLVDLEGRGLLMRFKVGRQHAWRPADGLESLLRTTTE